MPDWLKVARTRVRATAAGRCCARSARTAGSSAGSSVGASSAPIRTCPAFTLTCPNTSRGLRSKWTSSPIEKGFPSRRSGRIRRKRNQVSRSFSSSWLKMTPSVSYLIWSGMSTRPASSPRGQSTHVMNKVSRVFHEGISTFFTVTGLPRRFALVSVLGNLSLA